MSTFRALIATQQDKKITTSFEQVSKDALPAGELLVRVEYSSLNYKDGLAVTGKPGVMRNFPMVPGIDLAGVVEESSNASIAVGMRVAVTGCGLSETHWGGYAQYARIPAEWAAPLPDSMSLTQAMAIGTAGFTAMQCAMSLERHGVLPGGKPVVVTGAAGGVGSVAVAILAKLGYQVAASTGRPETADFLRHLGATEIVDRSTLAVTTHKPMEAERWAGAVDTVGGDTLATLIRTTSALGSISACGLAGGALLNTTVYPFILRGITLAGINSVYVSNAERRVVWGRLAQDLKMDLLDGLTEVHPLSGIQALGEQILHGQVRGRTVIDVNK